MAFQDEQQKNVPLCHVALSEADTKKAEKDNLLLPFSTFLQSYILFSLKPKLVEAADHFVTIAMEDEIDCMYTGDFLLEICGEPAPGGSVGAFFFVLGIFYCVSCQFQSSCKCSALVF